MGIGLTSPLYPLHISGDVYWTGTLQGGNVPWARLTDFPSACPEGYVVKAVGSNLTCTKVQVEGMVNGSGTVDHIPVWTGTNTLGDSKIHQFGNSIIFEGDIDLNTHNLFGANQINASSFYQNGKLVIASGTAAGGDLSGTYPNPTVAKIRGITVSTTSPSSGQALVYDGTEYLPTGIIVDNDLVLDGNNRIYQINIAGTNREIKASDLACTDCVTLGIETTGNYVVNITGGTGILVSGTQGEGWSPIVTIDTNIVPRKDVDENIPGNWIFQNDLTVMKNLRVAGNITYVNISHINVNGSFVPYFNNIFSLGTSTNKWANIYGVDIRGDSVYSGGNAVLTTATSFSDTSSSDISVTGTYDNLNLQIKAGAVGTSEISQIGCNPGYALRVIGGGNYICEQINATVGVGNISGGGTATQIAFFTDTNTIGSDSNLYWDNIEKRLGIGTTSPAYKLDVNGDSIIRGWVRVTGQRGLYFQDYGGGWYMSDSTWIRAYNNKPVYSGGEIRSGNNMRAPIFYDLNDGSYYVDPNSWSYLQNIQIQSSGTPHYRWKNIGDDDFFGVGMWNSTTDRLEWYYYNGSKYKWAAMTFCVNHDLSSPRLTIGGYCTGNSRNLYVYGTGEFTGNLYAPILYDRDNTGYYVDPASTSNIKAMNMHGTLNMNNANINGVNALHIVDPGDQEGIIWDGSQAKIFVSPFDGGNSDGYLRIINDAGIVLEAPEDSERMFINSNGNVGIGTTSPSNKLEVYGGNIEINNAGYSGTYNIRGLRVYYMGDDTQVSRTSTSWTTVKQARIYLDSDYGIKPRYLTFIASLWNSGSGTSYLRVCVDSTCSSTISTSATSESFFQGYVGISGLGEGIHTLKVDIYTSAGTVYQRYIDFYYVY